MLTNGVVVAVGGDIPDRHDQVPDADGRVLPRGGAKVQVDAGLRAHGLADGGYQRVPSGVGADSHSVRNYACFIGLRTETLRGV